MTNISEKLRIYKAKNKLNYADIASFCGVSIQAIKNICNEDRCPKKLRKDFAEKLVAFCEGYITFKDCGWKCW